MYNEPKREFFLIILLSALFHLLLFIVLLLSKLDDSVKEYKKHLTKKKEKKEAKVIFKKQPKKRAVPLLAAGAASPASPATQPAQPQPQMPQPSEKPEQPPTPNKLVQKKIPPDKSIEEKTSPPDQQEEQKIAERQPKPLEPEKQIKPFKPIQPMQAITHALPKPKPPLPTPPKPPEKKLTLADITKGFMQYARKENVLRPTTNSNHLVTVVSKKMGKATADQLKHERYIKKLFDCLDVSFAYLRSTFRFTHLPKRDMLKIFVQLDLDKQGKIVALKIVERSGNAQFDIFVKKVFEDAAKSFPPVPSFFDTDIYSLPIQCYIPSLSLFNRRQRVRM